MNSTNRKQYFSWSSWVRTDVIKYITKNSGKVDTTDIISVVGRDGQIDPDLVMNEINALKDDGSIVFDKRECVYSQVRRR